MEALQNLLREANNQRGAVGPPASSLSSSATLSQQIQAQALSMGLSAPTASNGQDNMGMQMGMSLPLPLVNGTGSSSLAPIGRMNPMLGNAPTMFSTMTSAGGMSLPMPPLQSALAPSTLARAPTTTPVVTSASSSTPTAASSASNEKTKSATAPSAMSKKRKAPSSSTSDVVKSGDNSGDKSPEEYEDPKAKRRAQIAKAARKHRQRQKDELIALRAKVKDLKEQIEVLQSSEPSEHNTELGWKQEAEQHAEIRARVDQENEFLRKTLMEQMKFIQRLQDYFAKQPLLNMPSLDMILNSTSSPHPAPATLPSTVAAASPSMQMQSSSFNDRVLTMVNDVMLNVEKQLQACEIAFQTPKNPTMTYFGLQVQYEMTKDEMAIFFRHQLYNCSAKRVLDDLWECVGDPAFEKKFPFVNSAEVLEELDQNSKYVRRVVTLTLANDLSQGGGSIKEESLVVHQKRENPDGSVYIVGKSVDNDPKHPKSHDFIRRDQVSVVSLRDFTDASGSGCSMLWSTRVFVDKNPEDRSKPFNIPDIILKNLFEITPVFVKGIVDRARTGAAPPMALR